MWNVYADECTYEQIISNFYAFIWFSLLTIHNKITNKKVIGNSCKYNVLIDLSIALIFKVPFKCIYLFIQMTDFFIYKYIGMHQLWVIFTWIIITYKVWSYFELTKLYNACNVVKVYN